LRPSPGAWSKYHLRTPSLGAPRARAQPRDRGKTRGPMSPRASAFATARLVAARRTLVALATVAYVAVVAIRRMEGVGLRTWGISAVALGMAALSARRRPLAPAARAAIWGCAIVVASTAALHDGDERGWLDVFGAIGAGVAAIG